MYLAIVEKELWTQMISSNFQNSTFKIITITVTEIILIQVFLFSVGSKQQQNKNENTMPPSNHSKVSSTQNQGIPFFSCLGKVKVFPIIRSSSLSRRSTFAWKASVNFVFLMGLDGWVFVCELSGCEIDSPCGYFSVRYCALFEEGPPWNSGN